MTRVLDLIYASDEIGRKSSSIFFIRIYCIFIAINSLFFFFRYAKKVVNSFRFMIVYAIGVSTFALTLYGIIMIVVSKIFVSYKYIV